MKEYHINKIVARRDGGGMELVEKCKTIEDARLRKKSLQMGTQFKDAFYVIREVEVREKNDPK